MKAYRQTQATSPKRIDLLLALFDGAIERLVRAQAALDHGDAIGATSLAARAQLIVLELAAGVRPEVMPEVSGNILRLYEFAANQLKDVTVTSVGATIQVLSTLRDGFRSIREEAIHLEDAGTIPAVQESSLVAASC